MRWLLAMFLIGCGGASVSDDAGLDAGRDAGVDGGHDGGLDGGSSDGGQCATYFTARFTYRNNTAFPCMTPPTNCEQARTFDAGCPGRLRNIYTDAGCIVGADDFDLQIDCRALCAQAAGSQCCSSAPLGAERFNCSWSPP